MRALGFFSHLVGGKIRSGRLRDVKHLADEGCALNGVAGDARREVQMVLGVLQRPRRHRRAPRGCCIWTCWSKKFTLTHAWTGADTHNPHSPTSKQASCSLFLFLYGVLSINCKRILHTIHVPSNLDSSIFSGTLIIIFSSKFLVHILYGA